MKIPNSGRKKALFLIDIQSDFLDARNKYIIDNIKKLLDKVKYDIYIEAVFYSKKGSLWDLQQHIIFPLGDKTKTVDDLKNVYSKLKIVQVKKQTRSIFKEDQNKLLQILKDNDIEEVHLVGTQTNDCILASAFDAFDNGYIPYVIEECCETATKELQKYGIALFRRQHMSNNSVIEKADFIEI